MKPEPVLNELFCFLLDVPSIEGTIVARKIKKVTASGFENKTAYALKSNSQSLSRSNHMYSQAQMEQMKTQLAGMIRFWHYDGSSSHPDAVRTDFFDLQEVSDPSNAS